MEILLNCLPPADIHSPSISLSILKKFMMNHGVATGVKYWNFSLSVMAEYTNSEDTEIRLLPFLSMLNDKHKNDEGNQRILSLLQKLDPSQKAIHPEYYTEFLDSKKNKIRDEIRRGLEEIDFESMLLFGITAKYSQWIPGMILAEEVKRIAPTVKIIVGGFGSEGGAHEALKLCPSFDFANWGEGEYPLLELCEQLKQDTPDYSNVPRMWYREHGNPIKSLTQSSKYLDFEQYIFPDYDDFVLNYPEKEDQDLINIPINTIRSCNWGKCKFCDFNKGYKLRMRSPECIINEIEHISQSYNFCTFTFVDSDTFGNPDHFRKLLDLIIDLKHRTDKDFVFWAEIIPNVNFTQQLMQRMAVAGFKNLFIGYDGLSDTMLNKMNKRNSFSDNLFFVKESLKCGISPLVNVIRHIPDETESDVRECIDNLHFLRFFYHDSVVSFSHIYVNLVLSSMSKYYRILQKEERAFYNYDLLASLLPESFSDSHDRFHLFRFENILPKNAKAWENLEEIEKYYMAAQYNYKLIGNDGIYYYTEYCGDEEIASLTFSDPEYVFLLKASSKKIYSFESLYAEMKMTFKNLSENKLKIILKNLRESYLVYFNADFENIVSIIEE